MVMRLMDPDQEFSRLLITVERAGEEMTLPVDAVRDEETRRYILGVDLTPEVRTKLVRYNIFAAVGQAFKKLLGMIAQLFVILKLLLTGDLPARSMGGAIGIVQMTAQVAQFGFVAVLEFIAFISVNLGIVNLLPIPIADGGQIVFLGIEKATGRPLSKKTMGVIMNIGLYLVIALLVLTTYNDIMRIIKGVF
jgi:regulator of sigma E protease